MRSRYAVYHIAHPVIFPCYGALRLTRAVLNRKTQLSQVVMTEGGMARIENNLMKLGCTSGSETEPNV
jgi:hypothetical protein